MQNTLILRLETEYKIEFPPEVAGRLPLDKLQGTHGTLDHPTLGRVRVTVVDASSAKPAAVAEAPATKASMRPINPDIPASWLVPGVFGDAPSAEPLTPPGGMRRRPSPPSARCTCGPQKLPRAHARRCPDYSEADHAWCLTRWVHEGTGTRLTYEEALAEVLRESQIPVGTPIRMAPSAEPEALGRDVSGAALDAAIKPAADVPAAPSAPPEPKAERPSPPTERCSCRLTVPSGLPRAHSTRCPDYTPEDAEWARQHWTNCKAAPSAKPEALGRDVSGAALAEALKPATLTMPDLPPITVTVRVGEKRGRVVRGEELRTKEPGPHRCGACRACLGQTASAFCERELVASREEVRRLWCHVQAIGPATLRPERERMIAALRSEVEQLAERAGVR